MEKIDLKVSTAYGVYKQALYIFLMLIFLFLTAFFPLYRIIFLSVACVFLIRIIYGILYYRLILIEIFPDRLSIRKGVFTYAKSFLELYRVKDYEVKQSLFMRIFGIMAITLHTSDKTSPVLDLVGVPKSNIVDIIREYVEAQRKLKGVREFD